MLLPLTEPCVRFFGTRLFKQSSASSPRYRPSASTPQCRSSRFAGTSDIEAFPSGHDGSACDRFHASGISRISESAISFHSCHSSCSAPGQQPPAFPLSVLLASSVAFAATPLPPASLLSASSCWCGLQHHSFHVHHSLLTAPSAMTLPQSARTR